MLLTLASRTTILGVGDTGDHVIAHMVSMSVKVTSQKNNELRLFQEVSHMCTKVLKMLACIDHVL